MKRLYREKEGNCLMMEQNSDRLYWIIGAILVGTALIMVAYKFFPGLFKGSIFKQFTNLFNNNIDGANHAGDNVTDIANR